MPGQPAVPDDPMLARLLDSLATEARQGDCAESWAEAEGVSRLLALRPSLPAAEARWRVREGLAAAFARRRSPPQHLLQALARPAVPRRTPPGEG